MYKVLLTEHAEETLSQIKDQRKLRQIGKQIDRLEQAPLKIGKPLSHDLSGFRSLRAASQRYRIIYSVLKNENVVYVVAVGLRKEGDRDDIYSKMSRWLKKGIFGWLFGK